jgi:hypothetical protein
MKRLKKYEIPDEMYGINIMKLLLQGILVRQSKSIVEL